MTFQSSLTFSRFVRSIGNLTLKQSCSTLSASSAQNTRTDRLFEKIEVEVRAHQPEVLKSYAWFATTAAKELDIEILESFAEPGPHKVRKTLLRSAFVNKKHRVQYEFRYGNSTFSNSTSM